MIKLIKIMLTFYSLLKSISKYKQRWLWCFKESKLEYDIYQLLDSWNNQGQDKRYRHKVKAAINYCALIES